MISPNYVSSKSAGFLAVALAVVVLEFVAFAIDVGSALLARAQLQNAADAGAHSGAASLGSGSVFTDAIAAAEAHPILGQRVTVDPSSDIQLGIWRDPTQTFTPIVSAEQVPNAVKVVCRSRFVRPGLPIPVPVAWIGATDFSSSAISVKSSSGTGARLVQ